MFGTTVGALERNVTPVTRREAFFTREAHTRPESRYRPSLSVTSLGLAALPLWSRSSNPGSIKQTGFIDYG